MMPTAANAMSLFSTASPIVTGFLSQVLPEELLRILVHYAIGILLRNASGDQILVNRRRLGRCIQALRQEGTVEIRTESKILFASQLKEMHGVTVDIVKAVNFAVIAQELHKVIQTDQAIAPDHLSDHVVCEVALVTAQRTGIGMRGDKGFGRHLQQVGKTVVVEVGDVDKNALFLHLAHSFLAKLA